MKRLRYSYLALILGSALPLSAYADGYLSNDNIRQFDARFNFFLANPLPAPIAKADGRGEAIENLVVKYASDYLNDIYLKEDVIRFRRWQWQDLYTSLDLKTKQKPDYLNTYRLQAEAYFINKQYQEALSQLDQILRRNPNDVHAMAMSVVASRVLENPNTEAERLLALYQISPSIAQKVQQYLHFTDTMLAASYGSEPQTTMIPDTIVVFGQSPNPDGTPSKGLLQRLEKTKEMAAKFPNAKIILSGGPVRYIYAEADVMKKWLIENGVDESRLLLDDVARDTPGNAVGIIDFMKEYGGRKVLGIGTILHLPRAMSVLKSYADSIGYELEIDSAGGGSPPNEKNKKGEALYTFVNVARAMGLFTLGDFENLLAKEQAEKEQREALEKAQQNYLEKLVAERDQAVKNAENSANELEVARQALETAKQAHQQAEEELNKELSKTQEQLKQSTEALSRLIIKQNNPFSEHYVVQLNLMEQATYDLYRRLAEIEHTQDWNLWLSDSLSKYRLKNRSTEDYHLLHIGLDHQVSHNWSIGGVFGISQGQIENRTHKVKGTSAGIYAGYRPTSGLFWTNFFNYSHFTNQSGVTKRDNNAYSLSSEIGRNIVMSHQWQITPKLQLGWAKAGSSRMFWAGTGLRLGKVIELNAIKLKPYADISYRFRNRHIDTLDSLSDRHRNVISIGIQAVGNRHYFAIEGSMLHGDALKRSYGLHANYHYQW
ncbi:autotransporter domain-containing protein [Mannheimia haemolytica]|uniref:autotransporter domain-containing protein n=1 Tax=Mannheimia haemolytica TaxID=75985 RepID=UPI00038569C3|nr:autotransporter domain-containing protein [Mannheimia haemolytica]EPZ00038.1 hypothetical protein L278_07520 [Mannheimia haemolytica D35]